MPPRLNVLALPTRTTLLFALIVLVIALPVGATLTGESPVCAPAIIALMLLLPLREFLQQPEKLIARGNMIPLDDSFARLHAEWDTLARQRRLKPPRLLQTSAESAEIFTFGTFTRRYTVLSHARATQLDRELQSPRDRLRAQAILLHELAHFYHRDVAMALFARALLRVTVAVMLISWFIAALTPFLYLTLISFFNLREYLPGEILAAMRAVEPDVTQAMLNPQTIPTEVWLRFEAAVLSQYVPLAVGAVILLVFYWRALVRTRELYADARVVAWQGDAAPLRAQLAREEAVAGLAPRPVSRWAKWKMLGEEMLGLGFTARRLGLDMHPTFDARRECLREPHQIYGDDRSIGVTAGGIVVLINLTLGSLFLSRYVRGPNSAAPFLVGFVVIALSLLPWLCQFPANTREYARKIARIVVIFTALKLALQFTGSAVLTLGVLLEPSLIDQAAYALVPGAGANLSPLGIPPEFVLETFVVRPAILFMIGMPLILIAWLRWDARIKRRMLTWFGAPLFARAPALVLASATGWLALVLALLVLPVLDALTNPTAHDLLDPFNLGRLSGGLIALVAGVALFRRWDARYAGQCPRCHARHAAPYHLGDQCAACGQLFHPPLIAAPELTPPPAVR